MSIGDCPNWPACGHKTMSQCDADAHGKRHQRLTPCKHCGAKQGEEHSVTCPYGVNACPTDQGDKHG